MAEKKQAKKRYRELTGELNAIVLRWDPYNLYRCGAPGDEFSTEVQKILAGLPRAASQRDVQELVQGVFSETFGREEFSLEACADVAREITLWWQRRGWSA